MNVTQRLLAKDTSLKIYKEGDWTKPVVLPVEGFTSFNDAGIECETGEFLYSLVRLIKPEQILETGTHWGIGTSYMALALEDNLKGKLTTVEFLPEIWKRAKERFKTLGITNRVRSILQDVTKVKFDEQFDLILLDTEPQTRFGELVQFFDNLKPGGFIFIHDLHRHMGQMPNEEHGFAWPWGKIPEPMQELVKSGQLRPFYFDTPRGLTGFYKPSPADYDWKL